MNYIHRNIFHNRSFIDALTFPNYFPIYSHFSSFLQFYAHLFHYPHLVQFMMHFIEKKKKEGERETSGRSAVTLFLHHV